MNHLNKPHFWEESWHTHLESYLKANPRNGIFIKYLLGNQINSAIEIACGSSRDSIYLAMEGYKSTATDFDAKTITYLTEKFENVENLDYQTANAFNLPFDDSSFDLVYHNGFFVCLDNNEDLFRLLKEQERVAKKYIWILVHNQLNRKMVSQFEKLSQADKLYNIRFFTPNELEQLVYDSCIKLKQMKILKFGSSGKLGVDYWSSKFPMKNLLSKEMLENIAPKMYQSQSWEQTERVACLIELDK